MTRNLNVAIPPKVMRRVKMAAAAEGKPIYEWVAEVLNRASAQSILRKR